MVIFQFPGSSLGQREKYETADPAKSVGFVVPAPSQEEVSSPQRRATQSSNLRHLRVAVPDESAGQGETEDAESKPASPPVVKDRTYGYKERSAKSLKGLAAHCVIPHQVREAPASRQILIYTAPRRMAIHPETPALV